ncbi:MAG: hypothetical protein VX438_01220, partial [Planctomycetota bacterium]|nr:hypothetical protein [Planctomycetota bacterium]
DPTPVKPNFRYWQYNITVALILSISGSAFGQLQYPVDVAVSGEDIYVVDRKLPGVLKIDTNGTLSEIFKASKKFRTPLNAARCVVVSPQGTIIVGDSSTRQLYKMGGANPEPLLTNPTGIGVPYAMVFDKDENLFVADLEAPGRIFKIPAGSTQPEPFAIQPGVRGLAVDPQGNLIAVTGLAEALLKYSPAGKRTVIAGNRPFRFPNSVAVKGDQIFVCDSYKKCVWQINPAGEVTEFCSEGISYPGGLAVQGDKLLVTDSKAKKIFSIGNDGKAVEVPIK